MNFIINRVYQFKCNSITHNYRFTVNSSLPQGSHCGPLLFIIMTLDIIECLHDTKDRMLLYADDTKIYSIVNSDESRIELQLVIDSLTKWSETNRLSLNYDKTIHITYCKSKVRYLSYYYIGSTRIKQTEEVKDLGVVFDHKLTFKSHILQLITKVTCMFGIGYRFCQELRSPLLMIKILNTYIRPLLEY